MTPDKPEAVRLLETAQTLFKQDILSDLPEEKRLDALMILNILGIAERALDDSADLLDARQTARLTILMGPEGDVATLARQIRAGAWDAPEAARRLHAVLTEDARDRLARANPKYLQAVEAEEGSG